jgi:hypothetical protein
LLGRADEGVCPYAQCDYLRTVLSRKKISNNDCVASNLPYSLCCELTSPKCPWNRSYPGAAKIQGRRGGESESLEEEAIEIGNS